MISKTYLEFGLRCAKNLDKMKNSINILAGIKIKYNCKRYNTHWKFEENYQKREKAKKKQSARKDRKERMKKSYKHYWKKANWKQNR